ncbi:MULTISPECIES: VOC family protein [Nocardioides]|uniref:VOC family protein n=1 Tax=Nocardioides vastitatis TaxID=2568655 RepID=A0ABW0ZHX3_9ACTN|nr:VOC family protein [Nocardioides sp.]THJ08624.1 VOC family protein [Nocardioides sp.]
MPNDLQGIYAVKLPVRDLVESRDWYERVFGFTVELEFPDADGVVRGITGHLVGVPGTWLGLRESPTHAAGVAGFNLVNFAVADRPALEEWATRLDELGIRHSRVIEASIGWIVVLDDPNGIELHLYTQTRHGIDQSARPGYGRPVPAPPEPWAEGAPT